MRSEADDLRDERQDEELRLPFEERMALVLRLGERGLEMFCQAGDRDPGTPTSAPSRTHTLEVHVRADRMSLLEEIGSTHEVPGIPHTLIGAATLTAYGVNHASVDLGLSLPLAGRGGYQEAEKST